MRIALIENEPECYEPYEVLLRERKHNVEVYEEADSVVDNLANICQADVIILDLMIQLGTKIQPREATETGTAIYNRIRKINPTVPIVVLTAKSRSDIWWNDFKGDGRVKYLLKPVTDLQKFYETIEIWS